MRTAQAARAEAHETHKSRTVKKPRARLSAERSKSVRTSASCARSKAHETHKSRTVKKPRARLSALQNRQRTASSTVSERSKPMLQGVVSSKIVRWMLELNKVSTDYLHCMTYSTLTELAGCSLSFGIDTSRVLSMSRVS